MLNKLKTKFYNGSDIKGKSTFFYNGAHIIIKPA